MTGLLSAAVDRRQVEQIVGSVFGTMLGVGVAPLSGDSMPAVPNLTAAVYYAGGWKGALLLECSAAHAANWAARLSPDAGDDPSEADSRDALGELVNMIGGNLKPLLGSGTALSMPSVVTGMDYALALCGANRTLRASFEDPLGGFRLTLVEIAEKPPLGGDRR